MLFTSPVFLLFFVCVLIASRLPLGWTGRKTLLLLASYAFYASWNPPFVMLLWVSTVVDYWVSLRMAKTRRRGRRRAYLIVSLCVNLGILGTFKYADFMLETFQQIAGWGGHKTSFATLNFVLPLGISFYTFQTMSYTIDVYRRKLKPTRNLLEFALYVTFFPQLVAGPIVRAKDFLWQLKTPRKPTAKMMYWGVILFIVGLFKKVFLADSIFAPIVDNIYQLTADPTFIQVWGATYSFAGQIYCDFSGYTDMAIATALMLGFRLPDNFRAPYGALGFSDFWRRWHISLSTWLRDYLYIPLGGNRKGAIRTRVNLMLTMLLGGLWHGASWTFVVWGGLHGAYLWGERALRRIFGDKPIRRWWVKGFVILVTFQMVCVAWVFFRAETFEQSMQLLARMFMVETGEGAIIQSRFMFGVAVLGVGGLVGVHWLLRNRRLEDVSAKAGWIATGIVTGVMLFLVLTAGGGNAEFIYFQF